MPTTTRPDSFLSRAEMQNIETLPAAELDKLPVGAIQLDRDGTVLKFNDHEAKLTGRKPKEVIGKNFFREVAPCTNVQGFAGKFREGVDRGDLHEVFPYRFDFRMAPRDVTVTLFYSQETQTAWVFVREIARGPA